MHQTDHEQAKKLGLPIGLEMSAHFDGEPQALDKLKDYALVLNDCSIVLCLLLRQCVAFKDKPEYLKAYAWFLETRLLGMEQSALCIFNYMLAQHARLPNDHAFPMCEVRTAFNYQPQQMIDQGVAHIAELFQWHPDYTMAFPYLQELNTSEGFRQAYFLSLLWSILTPGDTEIVAVRSSLQNAIKVVV